ncbi:MAG: tetratricopeptide repeat protein [Terracidiphilus sp.]|jgi:tetratricopeptide (TPR) repeat protein
MFRHRYAILFILAAAFAAQGQQSKVSIASIEGMIRSREYDRALETTRSALRDAPNDFRLWTLQGIALSLKGNNHDALNAFEKALSLSPNYVAALKGEAQLLYQAGDNRAIPILKRILKVDSKDETAREMLAVLEARQENCPAANDDFLLSAQAIASHPSSLEAYGNCLVQTGEPQKAVSVFEQLVALLPDRTYPKYDLAVVLVETRQDEAAVKVLEPLLAADQSDPDMLSLASEAYEAVGDTPKAAALLRQALVLSPANANYYNEFVVLCMNHESYQAGIDMLNAGLQRITGDPSLYLSRGLLYAQLADYDKAEADFNTAERLDSGQSLSAYAKDIVELQKDMSDKTHPDKALSLSEVRSQLKAHPDSPYLNFLLAKMLAYQGSDTDTEIQVSDEALKLALLAVKLKPDFTKARDLLASIYMSSGQYNLAIEQCRLALRYSPDDRAAIYHLIVALRHSGQSEHREEIQALAKRLSDLQQTSLKKETEMKRFKLEVQKPEPPN